MPFGMDDEQCRHQAMALQRNELLGHILNDLEEAALATWIATAPKDVSSREEAYNEYQGVKALRSTIDNTVSELENVTDTEGL